MKDSDKNKEKLRIANIQLKESEQQLKVANQKLKENNKQLIVSENKIRKHAHDLGERLKELDCLYRIAESIRTRETIEEILQDTASIIPLFWHYPEITRVKVRFDGNEYVSSIFKETKWKQSADIIVNGEKSGSIEVYYLEERPELDEGPFMKEELDLIEGVKKVISEAIERKLTEEELRESKAYLSVLLKTFSDAVFTVRMPERNISYINDALTDIFGYTPEEVIGKSTRMFYIDEKDYKFFGQKLQNAIHDKLPGIQIEQELLKKNGETIWTEIATTFLFDGENLSQVISVIRNISERKQAEEEISVSEEKFRILYENSPFGIILCEIIRNKEGKAIDFIYLEANESTGVNTGVQLNHIVGKKASEMVDKKIQSELTERYEKVVVTHRSVSYIQYFDVYKKTLQVTASYLYKDKFILNFIDISEQKKAEDEIISARDTAERYLDVAGSMILTLNKKGEIRMINQKGLEILEYSQDELIGKNWFDTCVPIDGIKEIKQVFAKIISGEIKSLDYYENEVVTKSGEVKTIFWLNTILRNEIGDITSVLSSGVDITERLRAEEKLLKEKEYYSSFVTSIKDWVWEMDLDGIHTFSNPAVESILGYKVDEVVGQHVSKLWKDEDKTNNSQKILSKALVNSKGWKNSVGRFQHKNGTIVTTESSASPILNSKNELVGFRGVDHDITKRLQVEEIIIENARILRNSQRIAKIGDWHLDIVNDKTFWSKEILEMYGRDVDGVAPNNSEWKKIIHPDDWDRLKSHVNKVILGECEYNIEYRIKRVDTGEIRYIHSLGELVYENDILIRLFGVDQDITDRKKAEIDLLESESRMKSIFRVAPIGIGVVVNREITFVNQRFCEMTGFSNEELIGQNARIVYPSDAEYEKVGKYKYIQIREFGTGTIETHFMKKDGGLVDVLLSSTPIDLNDISKGVIFTALDITESKKAQEEIKRFSRIFEDSLNEIYLFEVETLRFVQVNNAAINNLGYSIDELHGMSVLDIKPEFSEDNFAELIKPLLDGTKETIVFITHHKRKNGSLYDVEIHLQLLQFEKSKLFSAIAIDVTDRRKAEVELRESQERFNLAMKASQDGLFDWNLETNEIYYSPGWKSMLGYEYEEIPNDFTIWETNTHPDDVKRSWQMIEDVKSKQRDRFEIEFKMKHKDGHWVEILSRADAVFDESGKAVRMIGTHVDVTERKKAERELRNQYTTYYTLLQNLNGMVYNCENDRNWTMNFVSEGCFDLTGYKPDDLLKNNKIAYNDVILPEFRERVWTVWQEKLRNQEFVEMEYQIKTATGKIKWVLERGRGIFDGKGKLLHLEGYITDVTERKLVENTLRRSEEYNKAIINSSKDCIKLLDLDGNLIFMSNGGQTLLEIDDIDLYLDKSWVDFWKDEDNEAAKSAVQEAIDGKTGYFEGFCPTAKGTPKWWGIVVSPILSENGEVDKLLAVSRDISERKKTEEELTKHREKLEELVKERTAELETKNKRLEDFNKLFVGREFRIKELRTKVKNLEEKLGI